jgi:hypothetical protein
MVSIKIEFLLSTLDKPYTPLSTPKADWTFKIACYTSSFLVPSNPITPVAILAAPASPYKAYTPASSVAVSLESNLVAYAASLMASL